MGWDADMQFANINPMFAKFKSDGFYDLKATGANVVCFLKKFEKCATCSNPRQ